MDISSFFHYNENKYSCYFSVTIILLIETADPCLGKLSARSDWISMFRYLCTCILYNYISSIDCCSPKLTFSISSSMVDMVNVVSSISGDLTLLLSWRVSLDLPEEHDVGERISGRIGSGSWEKLSMD